MLHQIVCQAFLGLIITLYFLFMIVLIGSRFWWSLQYIYMNTLSKWSGDDVHEWYEKAKLMLKEGKNVPIVYLCSYTEMCAYRPDEFKAFLKDYPLYFLAFPGGEVCLYNNDNLVICSFWKHVLYHLMKIAGSKDPEKAVAYVIQEGEKEAKIKDLKKDENKIK